MTVVGLLLAAGRSTRFGSADKLVQPLNGLPLGLHAARTLLCLPLTMRFVVTGSAILAWPGFEQVHNDRPETGMGHSLALGAAAARRSGASAILVALADMPFVSRDHFERLLDCYRGPLTMAASGVGEIRMPPALIGVDWFPALEQLTGDQGARTLLDRAEIVSALPDEMVDIDRKRDLDAARQR